MTFRHNVVGRIMRRDLQTKTISVRHDVNRGTRRREFTTTFELDPHVTVTMEHHGLLRVVDVHAGQWVTVRYITARGARIATDIIVHDLHAMPQQPALPVDIPALYRTGMAAGT